MGILEAGSILEWENNEEARQFVKEVGIDLFIQLYLLHKDRYDPPHTLKWGEEIEFNMIEFDDDDHSLSLHANSGVVHEQLNKLENTISSHNKCVDQGGWHFEYGNYMIESVPGSPYNLSLNSITSLQRSLSYRRWKLENILPPYVDSTTMTVFPSLGNKHYNQLENSTHPDSRIASSVFLEDNIITEHARFKYLTKNIYKRRGAKVSILVPLYQDTYTQDSPIWKDSVEKDTIDRFELQKKSLITPNPIKDYIYMDGMGFGMGMGCAQCTYMLPKVEDARYLYDQFAVLSPLWLAMTASSPFFRGLLAATDTRWDALSQSVDCRTHEEMKTIPKSRYASVSLYISNESPLKDNLDELNDLNLPINQRAYEKILESGIDSIMAKHVAYMFIRDPFVVFNESLEEGNSFYYSHFENIQSTNWNSVRFKPPPSFTNSQSPIGWRVEFRTPELQISDFENAVFISFITILVKVIMKERLEFYIPISKNDENFISSRQENAILNQKFWFRNNISSHASDKTYQKMSLSEIMLTGVTNGKSNGLVNICKDFIEMEFNNGNCTKESKDLINQYLHFITLRVTGKVDTNATFFRKLIFAHPEYKHDSIIPPVVAYDLCRLATKVGSLSMQIPELYGPFTSQFNPGFESCGEEKNSHLSPILSQQSHDSKSTLDTYTNYSQSSPAPQGLQKYLYSLCHKHPDCNKYISVLPKKLESNFERITSFSLKKSPSDGSLTENIDTSNVEDSPTKLTEDSLKSSPYDYVLSEDFTMSWMMRNWIAMDYETATHYADDEESFDSQSEIFDKFNSEKESDYFQVVNELSA